jgi:hypothetical protein
MMRVRWVAFILILTVLLPFHAACANPPGYWKQMGITFTRGLKNIVSAPYEIPATIAKHHGDDNGNPRFFRDTAGFFDGIFRTVTRGASGLWDVVFAVVPGEQNEFQLKPETFF